MLSTAEITDIPNEDGWSGPQTFNLIDVRVLLTARLSDAVDEYISGLVSEHATRTIIHAADKASATDFFILSPNERVSSSPT
jgi:hypothetical protein